MSLFKFPGIFKVLVLVLLVGCVAPSQQPAARLKVLVVTGGHGFERTPFFKMFEENSDITFIAAEHSRTNASVYDRPDLFRYNTVVLYDLIQNITPAQKANLLGLCHHGVGLVILHHALTSYQDWPEYESILGGRYVEPDPAHPGKVTPKVGWKHDEEVPVVIVAKHHPITAGLQDFLIHDEIYWGYRVRPDVTPLITTTHPKSGTPLGWYHLYDKSRVVYLQLGHGPEAFENGNYRKLLAQSIRWAAHK